MQVGYQMYPQELSHLFKAVQFAASHTYTCAATPLQYAVAEVGPLYVHHLLWGDQFILGSE